MHLPVPKGRLRYVPTSARGPIQKDSFPRLPGSPKQVGVADWEHYGFLECLLGMGESCHFLEAHSLAFQDGGLNSFATPLRRSMLAPGGVLSTLYLKVWSSSTPADGAPIYKKIMIRNVHMNVTLCICCNIQFTCGNNRRAH